MKIGFADNFPRSAFYLVVKNWHAPDSLFGKVDERKHYSFEKAQEVFKEVWDRGLGAAVEDSPVSSYEVARDQITAQEQTYLRQDYEHRAVRYRNLTFVAQLNNTAQGYELDQLWFVHSHDKDNIILCVTFKSEEERQRFNTIARRKGFRDGRDLLQKYTDKILSEGQE